MHDIAGDGRGRVHGALERCAAGSRPAPGADDWLTKPCHPEELIARVEAVVRRRKRSPTRVDTGPVVAGELEIRADQFQAFVRGRSLDLTRREFEVLAAALRGDGQVLQREEIYQRVWGYAMAHGDRSVDVFIRKVRQKLEAVSPAGVHPHALRDRLSLRAPGREEPSGAAAPPSELDRAPITTPPPRTTSLGAARPYSGRMRPDGILIDAACRGRARRLICGRRQSACASDATMVTSSLPL